MRQKYLFLRNVCLRFKHAQAGSKAKTRKESDSLGELEVPCDKYYGCQTQRCINSFPVGGDFEKVQHCIIKAIAIVKKAAALTNAQCKLDCKIAQSIVKVCDEILAEKIGFEHFPCSVWQSGAGTATHMNVNEVISNRAIELSGGQLGFKRPVHPVDHVNKGQSTNDVIPSAIHIACIHCINKYLFPGLEALAESLQTKADEFKGSMKIGRTHGMDGVPICLGQEFYGYFTQLCFGINRVKTALPRLYQLPMGCTAIGSGLSSFKGYDKACCQKIAEFTKEPFVPASDLFEACAANDALTELSGALNTVACSVMKISKEIAFLASGPNGGIGELLLPVNEPGPIEPLQCEALSMIAAQVMGNHVAVTLGVATGLFQLNTSKLMMSSNLMRSIRLLGDGSKCFADRCVKQIKMDGEKMKNRADKSIGLARGLIKNVGYDKSVSIMQTAYTTRKDIKETALAAGVKEEDWEKMKKNLMGSKTC